jgi:hypothetical protein
VDDQKMDSWGKKSPDILQSPPILLFNGYWVLYAVLKRSGSKLTNQLVAKFLE